MDWRMIGLIWRLEIRTLLRSKRMIIMSVVLPMLIMPVMILASRFSVESQQRREDSTTYRYAIAGDWSDQTRSLLEAAQTDPAANVETFREVAVPDPAASVRSGDLHFYLNTLSPQSADREWAEREEESALDPSNRLARRIDGVPVVQIMVPGNRTTATAGARRMRTLLLSGRRLEAERIFAENGLDIRFRDLLPLEEVNIASRSQTTGLFVGRFLTLFLFVMTLTGGSVVAMDIIAGEKERGTLETLLTTAAGRTEIIAAKQLVILTAALAITLIQVGNLIAYTTLDFIPLPETFTLALSPGTAVALLILYIPLAVLLAGMLLLLSAYAKSYKEAQLYFFPLYLIGMLPAAAGAIAEIPLRSAIAVIPVANISVAAREVLSGHTDWAFLVLTVMVNSLAAFGLLRYSAGLLSDESVITAQQNPQLGRLAGPAAFRSHVWRWCMVIWAVFVATSISFPNIRTQVVLNEIVILLGSSLLIVRWYGLDASRALAMRRISLGLWPVVLLLIGPLLVTAGLVSRFANTIFPIPETYLDQLGEQFSVLEGIPSWQVFVMIAVLPGICEEVAFRGTLLYGLRRKFSLPTLALVVGLIFGFFHFDLFRIVTTGVLGIVITAIALMTGSIFPGMLLHLGNNGLALFLVDRGIPIDQLDPGIYAFAVGTTIVLLWIIYRNRTPYPAD